MIEPEHPGLFIGQQCRLLSLSRSTFYYLPVGESPANLTLMRLIDTVFLECPFYGARQMMFHLRRLGHAVGRKRVRRLMLLMGLSPIYQKPRTSDPHPQPPLHPAAEGCQGAHQHGWQGPLDGQRLHRTPVAVLEIRMRLSARLRDRLRASRRGDPVGRLLQRRQAAFIPGWTNAR